MSKYSLIRLKNGLTIISQHMPNVRSIAVSLSVRAGSRYETNETAGLAHFLEHMLFEGTRLYPTPKKLAEAIEKIGGYSGAYTDREYVVYNAKVLEKHIETVFRYLSQIIFNSILGSRSIEKEKGIVLEELKRIEDNPEHVIWEKWMKWVWGSEQSLGRSILGDKATVHKITKAKLCTYLRDLYVPQNMVVTVIGCFSPLEIEKNVRKYFHSEIVGKIPESQYLKLPKHKIKTKVEQSDTQQVQLLCGFVNDISYYHEDKFVIRLLVEILSGGVSARIFQKLIYQLGIAYSVYAYNMEFKDTGIFFISSGFAKENIARAVRAIFDELKDLQIKGISAEELASAKTRNIAKLYFSAEKPEYLADLYATQFIKEGRIMTIEELQEQINKVTSADIKRVMQKYFNNLDAFMMLRGSIGQDQVEIVDRIIGR